MKLTKVLLIAICALIWVSINPSTASVPGAKFNGTPVIGSAPLSVIFTDQSTGSPTGWAWFFGDETYAEPWIQANASSGWTGREYHTSTALPDGHIVLMGGYDGNYLNDTWLSADNGTTWIRQNASSGWSARTGLSTVGLPDNDVILMGGYDSNNFRNDVWRSVNYGATWAVMNTSSGWSAREAHSTVVLPDDLNSIVLMGGWDGAPTNDTWLSTDKGAVWTLINASSGWKARAIHCSVALPDNSIVLMGGYDGNYLNDTWLSADNGTTWIRQNASSGWSARSRHTCDAMPDGSIVLMGGNSNQGPMNDVWRSTDKGATWTSINTSADWGVRDGHTSVLLPDSSIVLMGGLRNNDTWQFQMVGSKNQSPSHIYAVPKTYQVTLQVYNADGFNSTLKKGYITVTIPPAPVASFTANVTSGSAPLAVQFNDTSTGFPSGWAWYFGDENYTAPWTKINASAVWPERWEHECVATPDGSIVLMGGLDSDAMFTGIGRNDTWRSTDYGASWTEVNESSGWPGRYGHSSVALPDGSIVLMGGVSNYTLRNDVWRSTDYGASWTEVNESAGWYPRQAFSSVVLPDGYIVLMGGLNLNDVWRSADNGSTWTQVNASAEWPGRYDHSSVAMPDGSIVLMGGYSSYGGFKNDTWRSADNGVTWTNMNSSSGWSGRVGFSNVVMPDSCIMLMGGMDDTAKNDVWRSTDYGATWTQVNASVGWAPRMWHCSAAMPDGSIILTGGAGTFGEMNGAWRLMTAGSSKQNPVHTYTRRGTYQVALQAFNDNGYNSTRKIVYITVTPPPHGIGVYRPSAHIFYLKNGTAFSWTTTAINWGTSTDLPVTGDWNGDSRTEVGVFRPSTHMFYLKNGTALSWTTTAINWGTSTDLPVTGDWNGDGITDVGVFRPSTHMFYLKNGTALSWTTTAINWGTSTDLPVTGDWNGDGRTEVGVYRPSMHMFYLKNGTALSWTTTAINWGASTDLPVTGDWNADGITDVGVFRPSTYMFYLRNGTSSWTTTAINWGTNTDLPVTGKW